MEASEGGAAKGCLTTSEGGAVEGRLKQKSEGGAAEGRRLEMSEGGVAVLLDLGLGISAFGARRNPCLGLEAGLRLPMRLSPGGGGSWGRLKQAAPDTAGGGRHAAAGGETNEEEVAVVVLKAGSVTLPLSSPRPISCSLCFWSRSSATLTRREGHLFLKMGTSCVEDITGGRGGGTEEEEEEDDDGGSPLHS